MIPHYFSYVISFSDEKGFKIEIHVARDTTVHDILKKMYGGQGGHKMILIFIYLNVYFFSFSTRRKFVWSGSIETSSS